MTKPRQAQLIPVEDTLGAAPALEKDEESGRYTAARLRSQKPELARAAVALLQAGYGLQDAADALGLHFYSVQALAAEAPEAVAVGKKMTARLAGNVGRRALEKINDYLESCTITKAQEAQQLATVAGIAIDKAQVLDGEPSEIVQHNAPGLTDVGGLMSKLLPGQRVSAGESSGQKGELEEAAAVAVLPGGAVVAAARRIAGRDDKSRVKEAEAAISSGSSAGVADVVAGSAVLDGSDEAPGAAGTMDERGPADGARSDAGRSDQGAGGGASLRPSSDSDASDSQNFFEQRDQSEQGETEQ